MQNFSRRQMLTMLAAGGVLAPFASPFALAAKNTVRRVVLVELAGGNDGLNTFIPYRNDHYHRARPRLAMGKDKVLRVSDELGFHPQAKAAHAMYKAGDMAVLLGVGYPYPNRSHFKSIALWSVGGDGKSAPSNGWICGGLEHQYPSIDAHGVSFAEDLAVFQSQEGIYISARNAAQLKNFALPSFESKASANKALEMVIARSQHLEQAMNSLRSKIPETGGAQKMNRMRDGFAKQNRKARSTLAAQLGEVFTLVKGGADIPAFHVRLGGFDTHRGQAARHNKLLSDLFQPIAEFRKQLRSVRQWDNTLILTYSEFGRRFGENNAGGTDHGAANTHFLMGGSVRGGIYGEYPSLAELDGNDDLQFTMDYRGVYAAILQGWFGDPSAGGFGKYRNPVLSRLFEI